MSPAKQKLGATDAPSAAALAVLKRVVAGEVLHGQRTFPYPFKFSISGVYGRNASAVSASVVDDLARRRLITAPQAQLGADYVQYAATDAGRKFCTAGEPPPSAQQADWTTEAGFEHPPVDPDNKRRLMRGRN